jgi:uncharacterized MAPEG superfamily protein
LLTDKENAVSIELTMLFYSTVLFFILILIPATEAILSNGLAAQAGARDRLPEPTVFNRRATRLRNNMLENMMLFVALVVLVQLAGANSAYTALGAQVFFWARVAHAVCYLAGWPWVRPLCWAVSVVGMIMMALALV